MEQLSSTINKLAKKIETIQAEEEPILDAPAPVEPMEQQPVEEQDTEAVLQEHIKNNLDKYKRAFEGMFPTTQMNVKAVEYRGMLLKDKIRVMVDFETTLLNFDALEVLSDKEIGLEASGEKMFRVYNILLPRVKDTTVKVVTAYNEGGIKIVEMLDKVASDIESEDKIIAHAIDRISDCLETVEAAVTIERLITKATPDKSFSIKDLKNVSNEDIAEAQKIIEGKPGMVEAGINPKALMLALALLAAGFNTANAQTVEKVMKMPTVEIKGKVPRVQMELQKNFPSLFTEKQAPAQQVTLKA